MTLHDFGKIKKEIYQNGKSGSVEASKHSSAVSFCFVCLLIFGCFVVQYGNTICSIITLEKLLLYQPVKSPIMSGFSKSCASYHQINETQKSIKPCHSPQKNKCKYHKHLKGTCNESSTCNCENYAKKPAAGGRFNNAHWLKTVARL